MVKRRSGKTDSVSALSTYVVALKSGVKQLGAEWRSWLPRVLLIAAAILWIFWPALRGGLVWDDGWYITNNALLVDPQGLWKFWFLPGSWVEYYPIQETVLWLQWRLFGMDTLGYHLTNVVLHFISALLVWRLFARLGLKWAWLGGLIFAVHPVQVESVAWISELKNALSMPFFLLAMTSWIDYDNRRDREDYQWALFLFLIGMLCKITLAAFPLIILLYAWWKHGRITLADFKTAIPFWIITLILGFTTVIAGKIYEAQGNAQELSTNLGAFPQMFARAGMIFGFYFANSLIPADLTPSYPKWETDPTSFFAYIPWIVLVATLGWAWKERQRWGRHVMLALGFFGLILGPFLGFHWVSYMVESWAELHMLYLPILALIGLFIAGLADFCAKAPRAWAVVSLVAVGAGLGIYTAQARSYAGWFVSENVLWTKTLEKNPSAWLAYYDLGCSDITDKHYEQAIVRLKQANVLLPNFSDGYYNLGVAYGKLGDKKEAEAHYRKAIELNPQSASAYLNLGEIRRGEGNLAAAEKEFRNGLAVAPADAGLSINLGNVLVKTGRNSEAIDLFRQALAKNSCSPELEYDLGVVLMKTNDITGAEEHLQKALDITPHMAGAHGSLGLIYAQTSRLPEAIREFKLALEQDPHIRNVRDNLIMALAQSGQYSEATEQAQLAIQDDPNDAHARDLLNKLQKVNGSQGGASPR